MVISNEGVTSFMRMFPDKNPVPGKDIIIHVETEREAILIQWLAKKGLATTMAQSYRPAPGQPTKKEWIAELTAVYEKVIEGASRTHRFTDRFDRYGEFGKYLSTGYCSQDVFVGPDVFEANKEEILDLIKREGYRFYISHGMKPGYFMPFHITPFGENTPMRFPEIPFNFTPWQP